MYWKENGIDILPYLDDPFFLILGYDNCLKLARIVEEDARLQALPSFGVISDGQFHSGFMYVVLATIIFKAQIER